MRRATARRAGRGPSRVRRTRPRASPAPGGSRGRACPPEPAPAGPVAPPPGGAAPARRRACGAARRGRPAPRPEAVEHPGLPRGACGASSTSGSPPGSTSTGFTSAPTPTSSARWLTCHRSSPPGWPSRGRATGTAWASSSTRRSRAAARSRAGPWRSWLTSSGSSRRRRGSWWPTCPAPRRAVYRPAPPRPEGPAGGCEVLRRLGGAPPTRGRRAPRPRRHPPRPLGRAGAALAALAAALDDAAPQPDRRGLPDRALGGRQVGRCSAASWPAGRRPTGASSWRASATSTRPSPIRRSTAWSTPWPATSGDCRAPSCKPFCRGTSARWPVSFGAAASRGGGPGAPRGGRGRLPAGPPEAGVRGVPRAARPAGRPHDTAGARRRRPPVGRPRRRGPS